MKFSNIVAAAAAFAPFAFANEIGCVSTVEAGKDYFPDKATAENSQFWSVAYENTYKIVSNTAAGETYLLYQCGTEPPAEQLDGRHSAVVSVPLDAAGLAFTTMIPFLELLGVRENIAAYFGGFGFVASPCLNELFNDGLVESVGSPSNASLIDNVPLDLPSFIGDFGDYAFEQTFRVSLTQETTNLATFEWVKFYSLFFNLEDKAAEIFDDVKTRYSCAQSNAALIACDAKKPVVLWGSYSAFCGGWDVAKCPNYYCEFADSCQADILQSESQGSFYSEACFRNYMTTEEFVEFGKDADHWIYPSPGIEDTLAEFADELSVFKSVQNQEVFDSEGVGENAWFEQRLVEPDVVLQDFCNVVGRENLDIPVPHTRVWFRNVYSEAKGELGQCTDTAAPLVPKATTCFDLPSTNCDVTETEAPVGTDAPVATDPPASDDPSSAFGISVAGQSMLVAALAVVLFN